MAQIDALFSQGAFSRTVAVIFVVVGNWHAGFDRLVRTIDTLVGCGQVTERVVAQIGHGRYIAEHFEYFRFCGSIDFERYLNEARIIISHAGVGVMTSAARLRKPAVVVPRRAELGEHYDNHQQETARQFESLGYVMVASDATELVMKIKQADGFVPAALNTSADLLETIRVYLADLSVSKRGHR